jgi:putative flippase GtrA
VRIPPRILRFVVVGVLNTAIDLIILFALTWLGVDVWLANIFSTSVALLFSFVVNRSFTFQSSGNPRQQIVPFLAVTLTGLWVLQPLVLVAVTGMLNGLWGEYVGLFAAKILATVVSMTWNYLLYNRLVFKAESSAPGESN